MKKATEKLFLFLIPCLFTFPVFKESISSLMVILLATNTLLFHISHKTFPDLKLKVLLLTLPFWILLIYSLVSNQLFENSAHIQHGLFFLIFPLCFLSIPNHFFSAKNMDFYFSVLKNTSLFICVFYVASYFYYHNFKELFIVFQNVSSFRNFIYDDLTTIKIHPTYFTSILVLCSTHAFEKVMKQKNYFELIYVFVFLLISFLLITKLNLIFLILVLLGMQMFRSQFTFKKKIGLTALLTFTISLLIFITPGIKSRFTEVINSSNRPPQGLEFDSTNIRKAIFDCSVSLMKSDYLYGVGFANLQNKLNDCYASNYNSSFYKEKEYLTHNYFFYIFISSGILGFMFFLFYVFNIIQIALKINNFIFNIFLINILLMCCIEDFLFRHYGILFLNLILLSFIKAFDFKTSLKNP